MRIKDMMTSLLEALKQPENRGKGHTRNAVKFAEEIDALYIMPLVGNFHNIKTDPKRLVSLTQIETGALRHKHKPLVLDNYTVTFLMEESLRAIRGMEDMVSAAERETYKAREEIETLKDDIIAYKTKLNKMREEINKFNKKMEKLDE